MNRQCVIMWEGPDMCGKTNIATAYSKLTGIPLYKDSSEWSYGLKTDHFLNLLRYADSRTLDMVKKLNLDVMFDRAYPSEWVYSQVFNRKSDGTALHTLDEEYAKLGAKIIICRRKSYDNIRDDRYDVIDSDKLKCIDEMYEKFLKWTVCDTHVMWVDDYYDKEKQCYDIDMQLYHVEKFIHLFGC